MADNVTADPGSGGATFATDDDGTAHHPYVKLEFGANDVQTPVDASNPLPVDLSNVTGTDGSAGPASGLSIGGTDGTGTFREALISSSGHLYTLGVNQEDVPSSGTAFGMPIFAVRDDALTAGAGVSADGDYTWLRVDNLGQLHTYLGDVTATDGSAGPWKALSISGTDSGGVAREIAVSSAGAVNTTGAAADNAAVTGAPVLSAGRYDITPATRDDGDVATLQTNATGSLRVDIATDSVGIGGGTQYSVDDPGPTVVTMAGAVRDDTVSALTEAEGDASLLRVNNNGALHVSLTADALGISGSLVDINSDTLGILGATQVEDDPFSAGSDRVMMAGAIRDDSLSALTPIEGDAVPLRVNSTGALHVTGGGGGTQYTVDDASPTVVTMSGAVRDDTLTTLTEIDGDATLLRVGSTGALHVNGAETENSPVAGKVLLAGGRYDATPRTLTDGDAGALAVNASGVLMISQANLPDTVGNDLANLSTVFGTSALDNATTGNAEGTGPSLRTSALNYVYNGASWDMVTEGSVAGSVKVDIAADSVGIGGGTQYTIDDASPTVVTMAGAIRDDTLSTLTPIEGDAVALRVNSTGALHVTGGGGGTQYNIDDAGPTVVTMAGVVRDDSLTTLTEIDGDATVLRVSSTGALHVTGGGGGTEYTEDVATANPIVGTATLMERDDALTAVTPIEGDWIGLRGSAEGALWTQDFNSDGILADTNTIAGDTTSIDGKITACDTGAVVISSGTVTAVTDITNTIDSTISGSALTALQLIDDAVHTDDAAFTLGTSKGVMAMGFAGTQSVNANDAAALACDTDGALHIADGGNSITVDASALDVRALTNADVVTAELSATDNAVLDTIDAVLDTINAKLVTGTVIGDVNLGATDNAVLDSIVTNTTGLAGTVSGSELQVDVVTSALPSGAATAANQLPATSGGISTVYRDEDLDETAVAVKASPGQVYWIHCINLDATPVYLHLYDVAQGSVTVGTTAELCSFAVPSQGDANGAGFTMHFNHGIEFGTAITAACTTTIGGTAGPAANEVIVNIGYA